MNDYVSLSIETHFFFARIMKEHSLFLEAGLPCCEKSLIGEAARFRTGFEELLGEVLALAPGQVHEAVLDSCELVTEFTVPAERRTESLSGVPINSQLSERVCGLKSRENTVESRFLFRRVMELNRRALRLLDGLIRFKERLLHRVKEGRLFTFHYPLLISHILREARLYRDIVKQLLSSQRISYQSLYETESFWNRIMMEHALFIRGLLDPSEEELIAAANGFSMDFAELLTRAADQEDTALSLTAETLDETKKYRDFKAAGAKGILDCSIASVILPLLADHVLREASHYIRILETGRSR